MNTLKSIDENQSAKIKKIMLTGGIRRRLIDIGLCEGTTVKCLHKGLGGDPVAYLINGAVIALRNIDAEKILTE